MSSLKAVLGEEEWKVNFYSRRSRFVSVSSLCNKLSFYLPQKILSATSKGHISVPLVITVSHGTLPQFCSLPVKSLPVCLPEHPPLVYSVPFSCIPDCWRYLSPRWPRCRYLDAPLYSCGLGISSGHDYFVSLVATTFLRDQNQSPEIWPHVRPKDKAAI